MMDPDLVTQLAALKEAVRRIEAAMQSHVEESRKHREDIEKKVDKVVATINKGRGAIWILAVLGTIGLAVAGWFDEHIAKAFGK